MTEATGCGSGGLAACSCRSGADAEAGRGARATTGSAGILAGANGVLTGATCLSAGAAPAPDGRFPNIQRYLKRLLLSESLQSESLPNRFPADGVHAKGILGDRSPAMDSWRITLSSTRSSSGRAA